MSEQSEGGGGGATKIEKEQKGYVFLSILKE